MTPSILSILDAMKFIFDSWSKIIQETILNYWSHIGLITCKQDVNSTEFQENMALRNAISRLNLFEPMTDAEYVNFPKERILENPLDKLLQCTKGDESDKDNS